MQFSTRKFLSDMFPDRAGIQGLLRAYGVKDVPSDAAIQKWFLRGSVPADWFALLLVYLELEQGEPVRLARYMEGENG